MSWVPSWKLYASNGVDLVYTFEHVLNWGDGIFQDPASDILHESTRGQGGIVSPGSTKTWTLPLDFYITGTDYADLIATLKAIPTTIVRNTKYILKVQLTEGGATEDLKVKRIGTSTIRMPIISRGGKVVSSQKCFINLLVNSWV